MEVRRDQQLPWPAMKADREPQKCRVWRSGVLQYNPISIRVVRAPLVPQPVWRLRAQQAFPQPGIAD